MTMAEANEELIKMGFEPVRTDHGPVDVMSGQRRQIPISTPVGLREAVKQLHADLDRWAHEAPPWLK